MSVEGILLATVIVGGTGLLLGLFLGVFGKKFQVETNEKADAVRDVLPGNNCGGCGYAGCSALAEAIVKGEAPVGGCPVGGASVAAQIGKILGKEVEEKKRMTGWDPLTGPGGGASGLPGENLPLPAARCGRCGEGSDC